MANTELDGRVVAVTGSARGIGLAVATSCVAAGMRVVIGDLDARAVDDVAKQLGPNAVGVVVDVSDEDSFASFLDAAEDHFGSLDVLINNAGVLRMGPLAEATADDVRLQLDVNVRGVVTGTRLAMQRFIARGEGHIVNMASSASMVAAPNGAVYSASKHAVLGLTRAVRGELRGTAVRTTIVMPGVIRTEMTQEFAPALGVRVVDPEAVAEAILSALRKGTPEVYVPKEVGLQGRLFTVLPARASDAMKRLARVDRVMH
ncbi:SDR family NAD(P)-dependent oxidoreductase [Aeromicrobium sp.]|uniref:SDR family NAD(P)-dependent oxidoreductase n=1 Tax=Aeromicrobium sp. TaxID=1871063 RepID=UPI0030BB5E81